MCSGASTADVGRFSVLLAEEPPQFSDQVLRVVALDGVAGARHRDELPVGQALRQADTVLLMEHIALAATHDEGRAGDAGEAVGQRGALGAVRILVEPLKPARSEEHTSELQSPCNL